MQRRTLVPWLFALVLLACSEPERLPPDEVCRRIDTVNLIAEISAVAVEAAGAECRSGFSRLRAENADLYGSTVDCVMAVSTSAGTDALAPCAAPVTAYFPSGFTPRPPPPPAVRPVTDPRMDPRTVEPCLEECGGASNASCWTPCLTRRAAAINAQLGP